MMATKEIELITTTEAAALVKLCRSRIAQLCASGEIKAYRRGTGHWRIDKQSLLKEFMPESEQIEFEKPEVIMPDMSIFDRIKDLVRHAK